MEERVANRRDATSAEAANEDAAPVAKKSRQLPRNSSADDATPLTISENPSGTGLRGTLHGDIFQLKLLMLFLVRGITSKFSFLLSTEMPGQGGKFDDLVFHYQDAPQGEYRYRYLQAKHKQVEDNRITASDLLNETNGDFSLQKYFRSYRNEIANQGLKVQDCIICTNIGFDDNVLKSKDFNFTLIKSDDKILGMKTYPNFDKEPARYKLNITRLDESKIFELLRESSEIHQLAKKLLEYANPKSKKKITNNVAIFKSYHVALVKERVIDRKTWKFHQDFITNNSNNLPTSTKKFRDVIFKFWNKDKKGERPANEFNDYLQGLQFDCSQDFGISKEQSHKTFDDVVTDEQIEDFLKKLVFAVNMPNEVRLGNILTEEVGQHFNLRECDFQSSFILENMLDWFKKRQGTVMATLEGRNLFEQTRRKMVALRATAFSIDFRAEYLPPYFRDSFQYQEETISEKANALKDFLNSPENNKTLRISTRSFRCTTVKILSALDTLPEFKDLEDGYLLMESQHLAKNHMKDWVKGAMKEDKSHHVLVVIGGTPLEVEKYEEDFMPVDRPGKKMIFICSDESVKDEAKDFQRDEFDYKMLSEKTIDDILSTKTTFQGNEKTLGNLVGGRNGLSEMLDSSSIEEILLHQNKVDIPSFKPQEFEKSLWIERFLLPPPITLDEHFLHELTKELGYTRDRLDKNCKFNPRTNRIEWLIDDIDEKSYIWKKMQTLLKKKEFPDTIPDSETTMICGSIPEIKLATGSESKSFFIITGVAGSGKSTALSRHYEHVKAANSNVWVITINLIKHSKYLSKLVINTVSDAIEFLVNFPGVTGDGAFARSLLRNRLINTGGVVLMLDGFDEINDQCSKTIIRLIEAIINGKTKLDRLLITTRPHLADKLFQFAFSLENFGKDHQVEYLMKYWQNKMTLSKEAIARKFASDLIDRVTEALKDKERTFIGIPLQCRILAECFQPQIESLTSGEQDLLTYSAPEIGPNYNVAQLYRMLFQKKRDIFQNKKATRSTDSDLIVKWALDEFLQTIDSYHFKLAIDTIFEEKYANLLWPPQQLSDRQNDEDKKEEKMRQYALQFGLTSVDTQNTRKLQFLHRTFAEYLVAEFLYKGFLSDENKHKDQIRDSDGPLRDFVIRHIFVGNAYEGVRIFLDSMLKDMVITNKTWRDAIAKSINESQPNQLQRFAHHFSFSMSDFLSSGSGAEAFLTTIQEGNVGLFDFMLDCLGAIYDRHSVQEMVTKAIDIGWSHLFFSRSVEIHQRIVDFFSDAELKTVNVLLNLMVEHFPFARAQCYSNFPPKARKAYLAFLLDFMEKHQKNLANLLNLEDLSFYLLEPKGHFIFDQYYDEELRRFMKLVITNRYTTPSSVHYFEENLDYGGKAMGGRNENWVNGSIEKILTILKDLQQDKILEKMSRAVLTSNPNLYQRFYRPSIFENDRIVELRESALKGDKHAISEVKWQFLASAVVGNEDVCEKMLQTLSTDKVDLPTEFIENALRIATSQSADMWTLIVRVVRRHFDRQNNNGQEALRHILTGQFDVIQDPLIQSFDHDILHKVVRMKVTEEQDGADFFREILLGTDSPTEMAKHYKEGFSLLLKHVLDHFNQQQLVKFIRLITSQDYTIEFQGVRYSIWAAEIVRSESYIDRNWSANCYRFLELVARQLDQESVINLLKHQEDNVFVLYQTALTHGDENFVDKMCSRYLSPENRDTVISDFYEKAPNIILDLFDRYSREMLPYGTKITALISFFVDHATDDQFLQSVEIITSGGTSSYWEYLFDHLSNEDILKILTRASKLPVGFEQVIQKLLPTEDISREHGAIIIRAAQQRGEEIIQTVCAILSESSQTQIANFLKRHATQRIEETFFSAGGLHWFWECNSEIRWNALNFFLNHGNDNQLSEMVNVLTTLRHVDERVCSIWNRSIQELANTPEFSAKGYPRAQVCRKLEIFLENVNDKIGGDSVIKLLLHNEGQENSEVVLIRIAMLYLGALSNDPYECTSRFTLKDTVLSQEKQVELRQLLKPAIDQFKREKCDVNSPFWTSASHSDNWTRALHFYLDYSTDPNLSTNFFHIMTYKRQRWEKTETSIWEYFFGSPPEEVRECFHLLRHVSEKLGEDVLKKLALEKDGNGRFLLGKALMKHAYQHSVKSMYAFLSTQARDEVIKELLSDPYVSSKLNVEIGSRSFSDNTNGELLMYLELVKSVRQIDGKRRSIWTNYVRKIGLNTEKFELLLKLVLDKLGEEYLKQLVLYDDDGEGESIISLAISQEHFSTIDAIFSFLSPASKTEVRQRGYTTIELIKRMVTSKGSDYWIIRHLKINSADGTASNLPGGFDVLASYFLDEFNLDQLKNFVKLITSLNKVKRETRSIWGDYIRKVCSIRPFNKQEEENQKFSVSSIDRFFKVVSDRLGTSAVVQLLYHYDSSCVVINYFVLKDCQEIANIAFYQLEQHEKNGKIRFCPINGRPKVEQPIEPSLHRQQRGKKKRDRKANK